MMRYDITTNEGVQIKSLTSIYGLHQLISDQTHLLQSSSQYIDLIFTDQRNLVVDKGGHLSFHTSSDYQRARSMGL